MRSEVLVVALISACGTPVTSSSDSGATLPSDAGTGDATVLVGTFQVLHLVGDGASPTASFFGKVYDGPTPQSLVWELDTKDGECELQTPRVPFCATPCGGSAVCVEDDVCKPYPTSRNLGTVNASGLITSGSFGTIDMTPVVNGYQPPASVSLAVPPFADGVALTVSAEGSSAVAPFSVTSSGVAPIALTSAAPTLQSGQPLELTWSPGSAATAARIKVKLDISHHGGTRGQILCDAEDDGALSVSAALTTRLISLGVSGFPSIVVQRQKVGSTVISAGRVDYVVGSELEQFVSIPGLTSCTDDSECVAPQTCQVDLRCQ
jgi:hypothetical protein